MKIWAAAIGGLVALLLLPMLAIGTLTAAIFPAAVARNCVSPVAAMPGTWRPPLAGQYSVTSGFGLRYHPVLHTTKLHTGIDLVATSDKTVVAAAGGTVKVRGYNTAYGNQVVIDHGRGIDTRYAHMASAPVATSGQKIGAGTRLGTQGATGYVTGAHLHFEVIKNGTPINPKPFMAGRGVPLNGGAPPSQSSPTVRTTTVSASTKASTTPGGVLTETRTDGQNITLNAEQLGNAATIIGVGQKVGAGTRGVVIALMTALQESVLRNLNYGDRDSLGLFQQRAGWGTAAQRRRPEWSARAFYGGPTGLNDGSPPGLLDKSGWKSMGLGQAAQAVQASAHPAAYDKWEPVARAIYSGKGGGRLGGADCEASGSMYGQLRVATWNLCLEFCGDKLKKSWVERIPLIAATIKKARPDVVALQETGNYKSHGAAIIKALAPTYKLAAYKRSKMVLYDPTKLSTQTTSGKKLRSAKFVVEGKGGVAQVLRDRATDKAIVVSSVHSNDGTNDARRRRYIMRAFDVVDGLRKSQRGSIIVWAGDLNSYFPGKGTKKNTAQFFAQRGYRSAEQIAKSRKGNEYKSYNGGHGPARGARIDHLIVDPRTVSVPKWQQVSAANAESDHNMIWVDLTLSGTAMATQGVG